MEVELIGLVNRIWVVSKRDESRTIPRKLVLNNWVNDAVYLKILFRNLEHLLNS